MIWACAVHHTDATLVFEAPSFWERFKARLGILPPDEDTYDEVIPGTLLREWELGDPEVPGWHPEVWGWSLGGRDSGADIEIDEDLTGYELGVFPVSNHVIVDGRACDKQPHDPGRLPPMALLLDGRWFPCDPFPEGRSTVYVRFDERPLRVGEHILVLRARWDEQTGRA